MTLRGAAIALGACAATLTRAALFSDRARLEAWQARRMRRWLRQTAGVEGLQDLPIMDRAALMAGFAAHNRLGLTAEAATAMAEGRAAPPPGHHVGLSTGTTSGVRMPYLISEAERFIWLGTILAKTLGLEALRRPRVAVALPRGSALYDAAGDGRALPLCFVSLGAGFSATLPALEGFAPDVLVAPPRYLGWLAGRRARLSPRRIYAAAEVLDPPERAAIRAGFPAARLGEIYMATEGLFAVSCGHGTLHLAEDRVHVELTEAGDGTLEPVVTDFTRRAQVMARYRTGDLVRLVSCPCGSPLRAVVVAGRVADRIGGIAPDVLRDAVLGAGARDFRLAQVGDETPVLTLPPGSETAGPRVALETLLGRAVTLQVARLAPPETTKLRRVMRSP
ncbi:CoF synthetase [Histidinibacterium lentulum]|uniref:CoF synthetase n=1 Tax=Histidinibacterium lentulum TaxID=2480588 RepID=A0A3N2R960_9RHOB|nr:CoF synthetase [Histidinibacterium lentulum]ROU03911.1 CoF synthetase [Histidinibacterium lentulum]